MGSRDPDRFPYAGLLRMVPVGRTWLAKCRGCGRKSTLPTATILERHPPRTPLHMIGQRLRCPGCDRIGSDIYLGELPDP